jgi:GxxExxY protein
MNNFSQKDKLIYKDLSFKIIGVLFEVSNELGFGYQERYFEEAVAKGLKLKGLHFQRQISYKLTFRNEIIGIFRLDFLIEDLIVLEIKTGKRFSKKDFDQVKAYLKATGKQLAIMAIFTNDGVRFYRVLNLNDEIKQTEADLKTSNLRKLINL